MASADQTTHLPAIGSHERADAGTQLQATLVDLIDLALVGKQMHWNLTGPHFRSLHLQLDEFVESWRALSDVVAERAAALGHSPDGQSQAVAGLGSKPLPREWLEDHFVVRELTRRLAEAAERARTRMDRLGEIDAASQDVLVAVVRALEEQLWMIRVQAGTSPEH